jgi:hypothetical protein
MRAPERTFTPCAPSADLLGEMGRRLAALFACCLVAGMLSTPAAAYRRLIEKDGRLVRPAFALVAGLGTYDPAGDNGNGSLQLSAGLRYIRPEYDDSIWHSVGFEVAASSWQSSTADVLTGTAEVLLFWPRTPAFTFDHHFFLGAGLGMADVDQSRFTGQSLPVGLLEGGLQGRVRDWYMELRAKYLVGPRRATFDLEGFAPSLAASYHFDI